MSDYFIVLITCKKLANENCTVGKKCLFQRTIINPDTRLKWPKAHKAFNCDFPLLIQLGFQRNIKLVVLHVRRGQHHRTYKPVEVLRVVHHFNYEHNFKDFQRKRVKSCSEMYSLFYIPYKRKKNNFLAVIMYSTNLMLYRR